MKRLIYFCFVIGTTLTASAQQSTAKDASIRAWAEITRSPLKIELKWDMYATTRGISIYKKALNESTWTFVTNLAATATSFTVPSPALGVATEWRIQKDIYDVNGQIQNYCNGYVYTGVDIPEDHYRGELLMLIDKKANDSLSNEIGRMILDMTGDGWTVDSAVIPSSMTAAQVKATIKNWYNARNNAKSVFIFGHVAVPYSGDMQGNSVGTVPADGHTPDHNGAWVADVYYTDMDGDYTDAVTNNGANRTANKNLPADGKYDQIGLATDAELEIARVDLSNLPLFPKTEMQLLKQYMDKLHAFKTAAWDIPRRGLIDDRLAYFGGEAPARGAWQSLVPAFGPANISEGNYFTTLKTSAYLVAHEVSTGGYTQYVGVGSSADYKDSVKSVFNSSFGSYFGDWDNSDNILRACLASPGYTLTNCWNGRPMFMFHHMALGKNIGHSVRTTQNNYGIFGIKDETYPILFMGGRMHISLMGDPTLRMHPVKMVSNISSVPVAGGKQGLTLNWAASTDSRIVGYNVYRAATEKGPFALVNSTRITGTGTTDYHPLAGNSVYMVRAVKLDSSASGTYFNQSIGDFHNATYNGPVEVEQMPVAKINTYPNPAISIVRVDAGPEFFSCSYLLSDQHGKAVRTGMMSGSSGFSLNVSNLNPGVYFITLKNNLEQSASGKIVIIR